MRINQEKHSTENWYKLRSFLYRRDRKNTHIITNRTVAGKTHYDIAESVNIVSMAEVDSQLT